MRGYESPASRIEANQREMIAKMIAWIEGTEACVGKLKANREKCDAVAKHQEVPNEESTVETIGALTGRPIWDQHLAVGHR
jgi:hypothetical protein